MRARETASLSLSISSLDEVDAAPVLGGGGEHGDPDLGGSAALDRTGGAALAPLTEVYKQRSDRPPGKGLLAIKLPRDKLRVKLECAQEFSEVALRIAGQLGCPGPWTTQSCSIRWAANAWRGVTAAVCHREVA